MSSNPSASVTQTISVFENLQPHKVVAAPASHKGREALRVTDAVLDEGEGNEDRLVVLGGATSVTGRLRSI